MSDGAKKKRNPKWPKGYILSKSTALSVAEVERLRKALKEMHPKVWESLREGRAGQAEGQQSSCGSGHACGNFGPCAHRTDDDCINEHVTVCDVEACPSQACKSHSCEVNGCSGQACSDFFTTAWTQQQGSSTRDIVATDGWSAFVKSLESGETRARLS